MKTPGTCFNKFVKETINNKYFLKAFNCCLIPIAIPLLVLRYVFKIKFFRVHGGRIGHLAMNNEILLRKQQLGLIDKKIKYIGIAHTSMCNNQLVKMLKRKLTIIQIPQPRFIRAITKSIAEKSILGKWDLFVVLPHDLRDFQEFNKTKPSLSFNKTEEGEGKKLLTKIGINNNWFICFHARDQVYVNELLKRGDSRYLYRNCDINNYLKAIEYITKKSGYALRMGAKVAANLPNLNNPLIIDYACNYRNDFGDIYLLANCKFFLGSTGGLAAISMIFNIPVAMANFIPLTPVQEQQHFLTGEKDLFIPKKIWSKEKKRFLTFKEIINFDLDNFSFETEDYERENLVPVENTAREILDLTIEMNERLNGNWKTTKEDEELQERFKLLFKLSTVQYHIPCRIGAKFLRENKFMLK